jgi:hypothetical protein
MRKFDDQAVQNADPAGSAGPEPDPDPVFRLVMPAPAAGRSANLRALVDFAIGRGYYEHWNNAAGPGVTACKSKDFPTDRDGDSN